MRADHDHYGEYAPDGHEHLLSHVAGAAAHDHDHDGDYMTGDEMVRLENKIRDLENTVAYGDAVNELTAQVDQLAARISYLEETGTPRNTLLRVLDWTNLDPIAADLLNPIHWPAEPRKELRDYITSTEFSHPADQSTRDRLLRILDEAEGI